MRPFTEAYLVISSLPTEKSGRSNLILLSAFWTLNVTYKRLGEHCKSLHRGNQFFQTRIQSSYTCGSPNRERCEHKFLRTRPVRSSRRRCASCPGTAAPLNSLGNAHGYPNSFVETKEKSVVCRTCRGFSIIISDATGAT